MKIKNYSSLIAISAVVLITSPLVQAMVPDPGNIYYGLAKDFLGNPLTPESGAEVVMARITEAGEIILSRSPILDIATSGGQVNYILRPSLDDGLAARYAPSAGRKDDVVALFLIHNGIRYETHSHSNCVVISDPVPTLGARGNVAKVDFRCIDDWDGDCMADSWEAHYFGTTEFEGTDDWDEDGRNDLAEFLMASDPFIEDPADSVAPIVPKLVISLPREGVARIDWLRQENVNYTLEWSSGLDGFVPVPAAKMIGDDGDEVDITGMSKRFFRVTFD
jgi:hypothetical protein